MPKYYLRDDPTYYTTIDDSKKSIDNVQNELDRLENNILSLVDGFLHLNPSLTISIGITTTEGVKDTTIERVNCDSKVSLRGDRVLIHDEIENVMDRRTFIPGNIKDPTL